MRDFLVEHLGRNTARGMLSRDSCGRYSLRSVNQSSALNSQIDLAPGNRMPCWVVEYRQGERKWRRQRERATRWSSSWKRSGWSRLA